MKPYRNTRANVLAVLSMLIVLGSVAAFARTHVANIFINSRSNTRQPDVKITVSGTVTREGNEIGLDKADAVTTGEILRWQIVSENQGTGPAHEYKAVGQIPQGTSLISESETVEGANITISQRSQAKTFHLRLLQRRQWL